MTERAESRAELSDRTDEVLREIRKQGRAAIAAQAAAESCLESIAQLRDDVGARTTIAGRDEGKERLVRDLMPVCDALDRVIEATQRLAPDETASWFDRLFGRKRRDGSRHVAEGVALLRRQMEAALADHDVEIDRRVGVDFDPHTQRAVTTVPCASGEAPGRVVAVLRPGYSIAGRILREADVTVSE